MPSNCRRYKRNNQIENQPKKRKKRRRSLFMWTTILQANKKKIKRKTPIKKNQIITKQILNENIWHLPLQMFDIVRRANVNKMPVCKWPIARMYRWFGCAIIVAGFVEKWIGTKSSDRLLYSNEKRAHKPNPICRTVLPAQQFPCHFFWPLLLTLFTTNAD